LLRFEWIRRPGDGEPDSFTDGIGVSCMSGCPDGRLGATYLGPATTEPDLSAGVVVDLQGASLASPARGAVVAWCEPDPDCPDSPAVIKISARGMYADSLKEEPAVLLLRAAPELELFPTPPDCDLWPDGSPYTPIPW
jgi:hypothetical protein